MRKPTVLIVDDDEDIRFVLENLLNYWGYQAITACGAKGTLEILKKKTPLAILSDIEMPGINGLQLLQIIKQQYPEVAVIMISGHGATTEDAKRSLKLGGFEFIPNPFDVEYLRRVLSAVEVFSYPEQRS